MRRRRDDSSLFYLHSTYSNPAGLSIVGLASMKKKKSATVCQLLQQLFRTGDILFTARYGVKFALMVESDLG